jgi:hypothetical protein
MRGPRGDSHEISCGRQLLPLPVVSGPAVAPSDRVSPVVWPGWPLLVRANISFLLSLPGRIDVNVDHCEKVKLFPLLRTAQAMRASLFGSAIASTLWWRRHESALVEGRQRMVHRSLGRTVALSISAAFSRSPRSPNGYHANPVHG